MGWGGTDSPAPTDNAATRLPGDPRAKGGGEKRLGWSGGKEERREGGKEGGFRAKGQEVRMEGRRQEGRRECGILEDTRAGGNNDNNNLM